MIINIAMFIVHVQVSMIKFPRYFFNHAPSAENPSLAAATLEQVKSKSHLVKVPPLHSFVKGESSKTP